MNGPGYQLIFELCTKRGEKKCKKDTIQQRINYSKTIITLPDRFLKYKALVKTILIGQVTVNIKRLGKHELTWQVLFLEENRQTVHSDPQLHVRPEAPGPL